jgi:hypothetical protein
LNEAAVGSIAFAGFSTRVVLAQGFGHMRLEHLTLDLPELQERENRNRNYEKEPHTDRYYLTGQRPTGGADEAGASEDSQERNYTQSPRPFQDRFPAAPQHPASFVGRKVLQLGAGPVVV